MESKKTGTVVSIAVIVSLGIGIAIGTMIKKCDSTSTAGGTVTDAKLNDLSVEELRIKLSEVMLPADEFEKLSGAIYQTGMGLFMSQAQQAGIEVNEAAQQELKKSIEEKYSRKYFADMNANSMTELTKPELVSVISFYNTESGQKFLKMSPKIIQTTMSAVQADLTQWLPKTVDDLVAKLKNGGNAPAVEGKPESVPAGKEEKPKKDGEVK